MIVMSLSPMLASAQMAYDVATFDTDESAPSREAAATRLQSAQFLKGDITAPNAAYSPSSGPRPASDTIDAETEAETPPEMYDPEPEPSEIYDDPDPEPEPEHAQEPSYAPMPDPTYKHEPEPAPKPVFAPMPEPKPAPMPEPASMPAPPAAPPPEPVAAPSAPVTYETAQGSYGSSDSHVSTNTGTANIRPGLDSQAHWQIRNGERLSDVFTRWSSSIGWQTTWEPDDLVALADLELDDSFTGAITKVVDALNRNGANVQVQFYAANRMLRIMARK